MPKLPTTPYGTRLGFTTRAQLHRFLAQQPRVLPTLPAAPAKRPRPGLGWLLLMVLASVLLTDAERGEPTAKPTPAAPHRRAETAFLLTLALLLLVLAALKH